MDDQFGYASWQNASEEVLSANFPLHKACRDGDTEALNLLLVEAALQNLHQEDSFYGWTPLHWAAYFGKLECVMKLLEWGVHCDLGTKKLKQSPAHIAAFAGRCHCLKWLIHCGANINFQLACLRKLLLECESGKYVNIRSSKFLETPGHFAAFGDHPHCLQWLLQMGADIDAQDYLGETPSHKAARTGSLECVSLLASHGARLHIKNNSGVTAAQVAHASGHNDCAQYIETAAIQQQQAPQHNISWSSYGFHLNPPSVNHQEVGEELVDRLESQMNGHMEDHAMEPDSQNITAKVKPHNKILDITVSPAVSLNIVSVAGRKRSRDDEEEHGYKRRKDNGCNPFEQESYDNGMMDMEVATQKLESIQNSEAGILQSWDMNGRESPDKIKHTQEQILGSSSITEHAEEVYCCQGYDSMCYDALTGLYNGS